MEADFFEELGQRPSWDSDSACKLLSDETLNSQNVPQGLGEVLSKYWAMLKSPRDTETV